MSHKGQPNDKAHQPTREKDRQELARTNGVFQRVSEDE